MNLRPLAVTLFLVCTCLVACTRDPMSGYDFGLPSNFPNPLVPAQNPMTAEKVELGQRLFYDTRLSANRTQSCGSCHVQRLGFADGLVTSVGSTGEVLRRNAMSLTNVAYNNIQTWANPALVHLEDQALVPMFSEHPVELGLASMEDELIRRLREEDPRYPNWFMQAFPQSANVDEAITVLNIVSAIAAFERTLISTNSPFDRFERGDSSALSASAQNGYAMFFSERLECFHCHGGFNFSDGVTHTGQIISELAFHNNGLYNVDARGSYPPSDTGLFEITQNPRDMGRFRSPTLRNIEVTGPYMHDGSLATLEEVLAHYEAGGQTIVDGPNAGVGSESPLKNAFIHGFELTTQERADVLAFLRSLTDETFLTDPRFSDPWVSESR